MLNRNILVYVCKVYSTSIPILRIRKALIWRRIRCQGLGPRTGLNCWIKSNTPYLPYIVYTAKPLKPTFTYVVYLLYVWSYLYLYWAAESGLRNRRERLYFNRRVTHRVPSLYPAIYLSTYYCFLVRVLCALAMYREVYRITMEK